MNRDREMNLTSFFSQDMMAPLDVVLHSSCPFECSDVLFPSRPREFRHNLFLKYRHRYSYVKAGTWCGSFPMLSSTGTLYIRQLPRWYFQLLPWEYRLFVMHPGRSVHSTTYRPSSSCSIRIENFINRSYTNDTQGLSIKIFEKKTHWKFVIVYAGGIKSNTMYNIMILPNQNTQNNYYI
jgi:hypothetical protein